MAEAITSRKHVLEVRLSGESGIVDFGTLRAFVERADAEGVPDHAEIGLHETWEGPQRPGVTFGESISAYTEDVANG